MKEMILIADSGSTKCDWAIVDEKGVTQASFSTMGLNPYFHDEKVVENTLLGVNGESHLFSKINRVFFYGAGASTVRLCNRIEKGLKQVFPEADIFVEHDLMGAAYATYDGRPSVCCILGTGSNSCFFDGKSIHEEVPSLAYILGDEASGGYFGKRLLRAYFYKQLPEEIKIAFEKEYSISHDDLVDRVYNKPHANVFLASFMGFIARFKDHPYVRNWLVEGMIEFLDIHVCCFPEHAEVPVHFVGSIGYYFNDCLLTALEAKGLTPGNIIRKPIDGLIDYHIKYNIAPA